MDLTVVLMGVVAILVAVALLRSWGAQTAVERIHARLDEQTLRSEALSAQLASQARGSEGVVRALDQDLREQNRALQQALLGQLADARQTQQQAIHELRQNLAESFSGLREGFERRQTEALRLLQESAERGADRMGARLSESLVRSTEEMGKRLEGLTQSTDQRLQEISGQVEQRLSEGFEKTTATFAEVRERLLLIDEAQKKITELSRNVVGLQEVLSDKSARGAFGEVQLENLVSNVLPAKSYALQYTLTNGNRVDCLLFLPPPTGNVPIDSKFPLENYRRKSDPALPEPERKSAERQFVRDVRTHLQDMAAKYLVPGETSDGVVMFIPAEAVFADIHGHYSDIVEEAQRLRVWMASPTTLMAILTTASAVLKDAATREQVGVLREHLVRLAEDFQRFEGRMDNLARHIRQAHEDVDDVKRSAKKITGRFQKIERLELADGQAPDERQGLLEWEENAGEARGAVE